MFEMCWFGTDEWSYYLREKEMNRSVSEVR
jgi:hypothetical protein